MEQARKKVEEKIAAGDTIGARRAALEFECEYQRYRASYPLYGIMLARG